MPERVAAFLKLHRSDVDDIEVVSYDPMAGGYSRSMASARVRYRSGEVMLEETVVLRGDPPAGHAMIETDRDHEWMVLEALTELGAIPIPAARYYDATGGHLGTKAIVMDHVAGGSLQSLLERSDDYGDHPTRLAELWGLVHSVESDQLPAAMPRPSSWDQRIDDLIEMWRTVEQRSVNSDPVSRYTAAWLSANKPPPLPLRLTHGDPQAPNVMIDAEGEYLLLDWEFASIGDPREDLGWYNIYSSAAGPNLYTHDPEAFLQAYRAATGFGEAEVNQWTVGYFTILAGVKVGATISEQLDRFALGENSGVMTAMQVGSLMYGHEQNLAAIAGLQAALEVRGAPS
ncbi:MAG: phosphotransferase family protein [Ilumatobacter sp.]|jgi:aminoglycoside phosphotransferase (APT) family kinase protein|uniref:phosphotransferase family protein n=1 Tax=Ilumatobacter sp. TaxID=1967498 RepID=UPI0039188B62